MGHGRHVTVTSTETIPNPYAEPPIGSIILFYGSIPTIPDGYNLCNGFNGTPDLRDKFIVGAGDTYDPADEGGLILHTHDIYDGVHSHTMAATPPLKAGTTYKKETNISLIEATTNNGNNLPPYKGVYFIKRTI
jgi:hypothetical protein